MLPIDVVDVVSNHETMRDLTEWHGVPFHHLPVGGTDRVEQEDRLSALMRDAEAEFLVLAR